MRYKRGRVQVVGGSDYRWCTKCDTARHKKHFNMTKRDVDPDEPCYICTPKKSRIKPKPTDVKAKKFDAQPPPLLKAEKKPSGLMLRGVAAREEGFRRMGAYCWCCGEDERMFLSLEHLNRQPDDDSSSHEAWIKALAADFVDYQVLCFNCNQGKARNGGTCPHVERLTLAVAITTRSTT